jgi:hypothetical protein
MIPFVDLIPFPGISNITKTDFARMPVEAPLCRLGTRLPKNVNGSQCITCIFMTFPQKTGPNGIRRFC